MRNESPAIHTHRTAPAASSARLSARSSPDPLFSFLQHNFLSFRSPKAIPFPISLTGWYSHTGSPNKKSRKKPAAQAASDIIITLF